MLRYVYRHRVRYRECDPMGVVYHTHYLDYFEAARTEALREMGVAYKSLEDDGIIMPVIEANLRYRQSAHYDDLLEIEVRFDGEVPRFRVPIDYVVRRAGEEAVLTTGQVTLCFVDVARQRPTPAPDSVTSAFARAFEAAGDEAIVLDPAA